MSIGLIGFKLPPFRWEGASRLTQTLNTGSHTAGFSYVGPYWPRLLPFFADLRSFES